MNPWVIQQHALSPESIEVVQGALDFGWVVVFHYYLGAARGPDAIAFTSLDQYRVHVEASRPGDKFVLWSIGRLVGDRLALVAVGPTENALSTTATLNKTDLEKIKDYLSIPPGPLESANEVLVAARSGDDVRPVALITDIDGMDDIEKIGHRLFTAGGEMYVLPLKAIEKPEFCLLNVKRGNEKGEVPSIGAY